jgi:hypothetical protein
MVVGNNNTSILVLVFHLHGLDYDFSDATVETEKHRMWHRSLNNKFSFMLPPKKFESKSMNQNKV